MLWFLIALAGGILFTGCMPELPPTLMLLLFFIPICTSAVYWTPRACALSLIGFCCGVAWAVGAGHQMLNNLLPEEWVGKDLWVEGVITELPVTDDRRQRFLFAVRTANSPGAGDRIIPFPAHLQLSLYDVESSIRPGERWRFLVRLKRPRAFVNPGGFDYEAWLLRRGVGATGYIRKSDGNQRLIEAGDWDLSHWRYGLREWLLATIDTNHHGILLALLIGDRSEIPKEQWQLLLATGTNHLIAISGLHVGFVALCGFGFGTVLGRSINLLWHRFPMIICAGLCASGLAAFYSALAGFSLPTQRALIMVLVAQLALLLRRSMRPRDGLLLAFVLVLMRDPLAGYDPGFWLSFTAVTVLLLGFTGRTLPPKQIPGSGLIFSQWVVFVGLFLPLVVLTNRVSLLAPVANLVAIPLVTFAVVPTLLVAAAIRDLFPAVSQLLLATADLGLAYLSEWLELLSSSGRLLTPDIAFSVGGLALAAAAAGLLLLPKGIPGRWLAWPLLCLALVIPANPRPPLKVTVLDVGQGLAVVVQTPNHTLVYDTGPAFSENFDAGSGILLPYLRREGVSHVDAIVISHNDQDHIGGFAALTAEMDFTSLLWGEHPRLHQPSFPQPNQSCHLTSEWAWDQISFRFITSPQSVTAKANNRSCVLLLEYAGHHILMPGDIEQAVELNLMARRALPEKVSVLIAPHHGSRTSSTLPFVKHLRPETVVFSAAYRSQYGHPHPLVVDRYQAVGSRRLTTAYAGALEFIWTEKNAVEVISYRQRQRRYWHEQEKK